MKTNYAFIFAAFAALVSPVSAKGAEATNDPSPAPDKIQIAVLLDTSNSMDGLIGQAKSQLWKVVNSFTEAKRDGKTPFVEVALYEYGNSNLNIANQYVRLIEPLSRDLDEISRELFALKTNGGEEYCGAVIQRALSDLAWDSSPQTYKVIFIAGNEPFTQGSVDVRQACKDAIGKGVIVNSIHCGTRDEGIAGSWNDGPALAGGKFLIIDQDRAVAAIPAPQDKAISDLSLELNKTYLGYGKNREAAALKQNTADRDAAANADAAVERAVTKASANYDNRSWDLVDGLREKKVDLSKIPAAELPTEMQSLTPEQRTAFVENAAKQRAEIQNKIAELSRDREAFLQKEREKQTAQGEKSLDEAIVETTREQATTLGYVFGK